MTKRVRHAPALTLDSRCPYCGTRYSYAWKPGPTLRAKLPAGAVGTVEISTSVCGECAGIPYEDESRPKHARPNFRAPEAGAR